AAAGRRKGSPLGRIFKPSLVILNAYAPKGARALSWLRCGTARVPPGPNSCDSILLSALRSRGRYGGSGYLLWFYQSAGGAPDRVLLAVAGRGADDKPQKGTDALRNRRHRRWLLLAQGRRAQSRRSVKSRSRANPRDPRTRIDCWRTRND